MSDLTMQWCAACNDWKEHGTWQHKDKERSNVAGYTLDPTVPIEIARAAQLVTNHFKSIGCRDWEFMGLAPRDLVARRDVEIVRLRKILAEVSDGVAVLEKGMDALMEDVLKVTTMATLDHLRHRVQ